MPKNFYIQEMNVLKEYDRMFNRLRKDLKIPLRQPLLDYAFGNTYLLPDYRRELARGINIYNQGYDFSDRNFYEGINNFEPPTGKHWEHYEENGKWVALYTKIPSWLKEIGDQRKKEREQIMKKQYA